MSPPTLNDCAICVQTKPDENNETLGITLEQSICMLYNCAFNGIFKYETRRAVHLKERIQYLKQIIPELTHLGGKGKYDFHCPQTDNHLSVKSTKKNGKVCPQIIGQTTLQKFRLYFSIPSYTKIQDYTVNNIFILLSEYEKNTFHCPVLYYNEYRDQVYLIRQEKKVQWDKYKIEFSHVRKNREWVESTTVYANNVPIGEFQIHRNRNCIKFRWHFEKLIQVYSFHFYIIEI